MERKLKGDLGDIGVNGPPVLIAGPCVIEGTALLFEIAKMLSSLALDAPVMLKASFDKANRTSAHSFRGPGLVEGLARLAEVKARFRLPILTDVHLPEQCDPAAAVADVLQIPAFLCRQTDLVEAAARTGRIVNIKRGQFLDPRQMRFAVEKAQNAGARAVWVTERGTAFGHGDLVFDPRALLWMRSCGAAVIYDCTHSVQSPGGTDRGADTTGGHRNLALPLARAAAAVGADGFYAEVHPNPSQARSDAATQLDFLSFRRMIVEILAIDGARRALATCP